MLITSSCCAESSLSSSLMSALRVCASSCSCSALTSSSCFTSRYFRACQKPLCDITPSIVKKMMSYRDIPENEMWRAPFIRELLEARHDRLEIPLDNHELEDLLSFICSSWSSLVVDFLSLGHQFLSSRYISIHLQEPSYHLFLRLYQNVFCFL